MTATDTAAPVPSDGSDLPETLLQGFEESLELMKEASPLLRPQYVTRLLSQVDVLTDSPEGMHLLRRRISELVEGGIFQGGPWEHPARLVPALVAGTLKAGGQTTLVEVLSELRMLALARGEMEDPTVSTQGARDFLRDVMVNALDLRFPGHTEEDRNLDPQLRTKIDHLMTVLAEEVPLEKIKDALATEIELICHQRPVVTSRALQLIELVHDEVGLEADGSEDHRLQRYIEAALAPSPAASDRSPAEYARFVKEASRAELEEECRLLAGTMRDTGLAVGAHAYLLRRVATDLPLLELALGLGPAGKAELERHHELVADLIGEVILPSSARSVYGLSRLLERGLLSRQPVLGGLRRLGTLEPHPHVAKAVKASRPGSDLTAAQLILSDTLCVLGQPLGVGQGRNPTCQSARGISLWSRHAPGKLLEMIRTVAQSNELTMRFEGQPIRSTQVAEGLLKEDEIDLELDAVSLILVPHLDKIYNEMMRRASNRADDPHKWVNPAMYGHWIPTGFLSAYNAVTGAISDYDTFVRTFYATHHPDFNRGHDLAYPNPVGIFLTSASGALIGFHAVSIVRVRRVDGEVRIFLVNPNTEGRQRWHADISPTVAGHGEEPGESSLPFDQFASRLYAFHFNPSDVGELDAVHEKMVKRVEEAARKSWGESYTWIG
jgi:hypothetical protein